MIEPAPRKPLSALQRFAQRARQAAEAAQERCEFCSAPIPRAHRHLLEVGAREIRCVCHACSLLFDREAASQGRYRLVPDRRLYLPDLRMSDAQWACLRVPVGVAFFSHSTPAQRVIASYPSPMGAAESLLELSAWEKLEESNPLLQGMQPDVEALLVNRVREARQHFLAPIDECYRLVALIRMHWRGLSGGQEVWNEIARFLDALRKRSKTVPSESLSEAWTQFPATGHALTPSRGPGPGRG